MKTSVNYFQYFDGLGYVTIPVIPAKGPATGYAAKSDNYLGKAPGFFDEAIGMWRGFSGWQDYRATQQDLVQWHDHGANVGLVLGEGLISIDIDASNEAVAEKVEKMGIPAGTLPTGWWVGFKIEDDVVWKDVLAGKRPQFSIHGKALREEVE